MTLKSQRKYHQYMNAIKWKYFDLVEMQRDKSAGLSGTNIKTILAQSNEVSFLLVMISSRSSFPQSISSMLPLKIASNSRAK